VDRLDCRGAGGERSGTVQGSTHRNPADHAPRSPRMASASGACGGWGGLGRSSHRPLRRQEWLRHLRAYGCVLVAAQKHNHACARTSHVLSSHSYASNEAIHKRRTGKKRYNHAHSRPVLYNGGQHIYLTKPPWYAVVGLHFDRYEKLLRYPKLATSSGEKRGGFPITQPGAGQTRTVPAAQL